MTNWRDFIKRYTYLMADPISYDRMIQARLLDVYHPSNDVFVMLAAERYHIGWMDVEEWQRKETKTAALLSAYGKTDLLERGYLDAGMLIDAPYAEVELSVLRLLQSEAMPDE